MSKYPENPYWHHERDVPIMILTRGEWDQAEATGQLTPEHVFQRLHNIAVHAFGEKDTAGFDDEGFVISLTAAGLPLDCGVTLRVFPNDHPPPHVHIELKSHPRSKLRVRLDTGEYMDDPPRGLNTKKLKGFTAAIAESHPVLADWWGKYHGEPVVVG